MKLTDRSLAEFLAALRSSDPTPGGGSASALAGAAGASLLAMIAGLPKPRATTEQDVERLTGAGATSADIAIRLTALVDRDSEAYDVVLAAYRLPKRSDEEKARRSERIQEALRAAIDTPLEVMRACARALGEAGSVAELGNPNASSDVLVARELLAAGLRGAGYNVDINLGSVKDQEYVARVRVETERLLSAIAATGDGSHVQRP